MEKTAASLRLWDGCAYWTLAERAIGYSEEAREKRRAGDYSRTSSASRTSEASEDGRKARGEEDPNIFGIIDKQKKRKKIGAQSI